MFTHKLSLPVLLLLASCRSGNEARPAVAAVAATAAPVTADRQAVVARLDGEPIHAGDVDDRVKGGLIRAEVEYRESTHKLRAQGLEELVDQRLAERKAKAEGLTREAYVEREVKALVKDPTDGEMRALYEQAKARGQELPPFEVVRPEITRFITERKTQEALEQVHVKLRESAKLESLLPALQLPRVDVDTKGPSLGADGAAVTIVAFSDYECPYCKQADPAVKQIVEAYPGKVRLVFREFPLPNHRHAQKASEAALCAGDQGKYWQMNEKLFANQEALEVAKLKEYARAVGLEQTAFDKCLDGGAKAKDIEASMKAGEDAGVSGTPSFFINGRPLSGAASFDRLKEIIDAELASGAKP